VVLLTNSYYVLLVAYCVPITAYITIQDGFLTAKILCSFT
jgi:hypothetical protein